ncbi:hypothetical protein BDY24DRAFT_389296 [Mrakia frigida]|uniref:uncharacterized protein n=1 Tax=Mrakia frigida TaxID=29902 RepID=UPI003FCBF1A8
MSSFSSLLKTSPFLSFTLTLYFLAAASSFLRLAGSLSFSEDPSASRRMERSGQSVLESKGGKEGGAKGSGIASLWPENKLKSGKENRWKDHNAKALHDLFNCLALETCGKRQSQVVILEAREFRMALTGWTSGEGIWARSITEVLESLGYTYIYARDMDHVGTFHLMLPDLIHAVVCSDHAIIPCSQNKDCIRSEENPMGVRMQNLFGLTFWGDVVNPLGPAWSLVPEGRETDRTYLGYTIEHQCMAMEVPKYEDKRRQVWILGKHHSYFTSEHFPYSRDIFAKASKALDVEFVGAWNDVADDDNLPVLGVTRLGGNHQLNETEFDKQLMGSLATVGLRDPWISPTPYYSVCYGVPFLNPTNDDGQSQHPFAAEMGEEHGIVTVMEYDDEAFISQLRKAITPHERYIPPWMTHTAMELRVDAWLQTNWTRKAEEAIEKEPERWVGFDHVVFN